MNNSWPALALPGGAEGAGCCAIALPIPITTRPATMLSTLFLIFLALPRLGYNINQRRFAAFDGCGSAAECRAKIFRIGDGPFRVQAHALGDFCEINIRIRERRA